MSQSIAEAAEGATPTAKKTRKKPERKAPPPLHPSLDTPLTIAQLAIVESTTPTLVYREVYAGMPVLRRGRSLRVTIRTWRDWWAARATAAGSR